MGNDLLKICHGTKITLFRIFEEPNRLEMFPALAQLFESVFDLFFPARCLHCNRGIASPKAVLCLYCEINLPLTYSHLMHPSPLKKYLFPALPLERVFALYVFEEGALIESLLYQFKYDGNKAIGVFFGRRLAGLIHHSKQAYDGIIGVPLHPKRKRKRGFNQVDVIGQTTAMLLSIPYFGEILQRVKHTPKLSQSKRDRGEILHNAFRLNPRVILPKGHYLLIDDILTTGATLSACSKVILEIAKVSLSIGTIVYRN